MNISFFNYPFTINKKVYYAFIPIVLFLISLIIYVFKLDHIPSGFHVDEVALSNFSLKLLSGQLTTLMGVGEHNHPIVSFLPQTLSLELLGRTVFAARLPSAIISALAIPIYYLLVKYLFNTKAALISSVLFLSSHLWIAMSRLALNNSQIVFFELTTFFFLFLALNKSKLFYFFLTGIGCGLMFYLYAGYRIVPLIVAIIFIYDTFIKNRKNIHLIDFLLKIVFIILGFLIISFPQINYFYQHPYAFTSRENDIYILGNSAEATQWRQSNYPNENNFQILSTQIFKTFMISSDAHDTSGQYGYPKKVLDPISLVLVLFGLIFCIYRIKESKYLFLILWFFITLLFGNILAIDPFFLPRATGVLPVVFIFSGLFLAKISDIYRQSQIIKMSLYIIIVISIASVAAVNLKIYFVDSEKQMFGDPNKYTATKIAYYLKPLENRYTIIFLTAPLLNSGYTSFISPYQKAYIDIADPNSYTPQKNSKILYIIYPSYTSLLSNIEKINPYGKVITFLNNFNNTQFIIYKVY